MENQRDAYRLLDQLPFVELMMRAEIITVIGDENHDSIFAQTMGFEVGHQAADSVVDPGAKTIVQSNQVAQVEARG